MSIINAIHQHYALPDPISWDGTFNGNQVLGQESKKNYNIQMFN